MGLFKPKNDGTERKLKYFVDVKGHGVYHVTADDAQQIYTLCEQLNDIPEGDAEAAFTEGRTVELSKSNAQKIWGEEMSDRELMMQTMKGNIFKKTAMSISLPKPKKEKTDE